MTTWYIAGPMTGRPDWNYPAFMEAEAWLRERFPGDTVLNPTTQFDGDTTLPRGTYLRHALANVASCDRILLLPGWTDSEGACLEVVAGYHCGVEFSLKNERPEANRDRLYYAALWFLTAKEEARAREPRQTPGQLLRALRLDMDMTFQTVADAVRVTPMEVSRWERGMAQPSDEQEKRLMELYGPAQKRLAVAAMGGEDVEIPEEGA